MKNTKKIGGAFFLIFMLLNALPSFGAGLPLANKEALQSTTQSQTKPVTALPTSLTKENIRAALSKLSDTDVRTILIQTLDKTALNQQSTQTTNAQTTLDNVSKFLNTVRQNGRQEIVSLPQLLTLFPTAFSRFWANFADKPHIFLFCLSLLLTLICGWAFKTLYQQVTRRYRHNLVQFEHARSWQKFIRLTLRFCLQIIGVAFFVFGGLIYFLIFPYHETILRYTVFLVIVFFALIQLVTLCSTFIFAPKAPHLRIVKTDYKTARYFTRQTFFAAAIMAFGICFGQWFQELNINMSEISIFYLTNGLIFRLTIIISIWHKRHALTTILIGPHKEEVSRVYRVFAKFWPHISIFLIALQWFVLHLMVLSHHNQNVNFFSIIASLTAILIIPVIEVILRTIIHDLCHPDTDEAEHVFKKNQQTEFIFVRISRVVISVFLLIFLTKIWGITPQSLALGGFLGHIFASSFNILMVLLFSYFIWEIVNFFINRKLAKEGYFNDSSSGPSGEIGGVGKSRLATILPLIQRSAQGAIILLATLSILRKLGADITPLIAGAGVIGLAIGFGAQTLVRDIVSGLFFLVDDAFRIGEYIDIGDVVGTVERINIRSLRLRHHRGAIHTIPFGEIKRITNYSRDWVIVKMEFRVPFETNIKTVKDIFKKIGQDLITDPELGKDFIAPFKSQGVNAMDDSALLVRGKFTAKPGRQFLIRRTIYTRIQKAFEEHGIAFARKQVMVYMPDNNEDTQSSKPSATKTTALAVAAQTLDEEAPSPKSTSLTSKPPS